MESTAKKTILFDEHLKHGGKIVEFGGFLMPIEYIGITEEHLVVREKCGLFDVSHMGEILITGPDTLVFIDYLITNDITNAPQMKMTYGLMLYPDGGVVDDLMVYKYSDQHCLLVVNAANTEKDYAWITANQGEYDVEILNQSNVYSQIALQGPQAVEILQSLTMYPLDELKLFDFAEFLINNKQFIVSRSGYTGEDGFEIYGNHQDVLELFKILVEEKNVQLCGLGCRDTLRFEAAMPLYGHEISQEIDPVSAGLNYAIKLDKEDFIGKDRLVQIKTEGPQRKLVGIELLDRGIARGGYEIVISDQKIGEVTTGYMIPNTNHSYALAYVASEYSKIGTEVYIRIRKNLVKAQIRNKKFLNKKYIK
ncbi:MAG: glycine cleavage system aminomethyltransferase GcvT [Bacilli bacterium]|nr:glycine cleavage system aminomethyltransferase GcvT [Bacilli bacterium]